MSLAAVFTQANTFLATKVTGIVTATGADQLRTEGAPPRVIWVPTQEDFGPSEQIGDSGTFGTNGTAGLQDVLYTRMVQVEAHIWGASVAATESLVTTVTQSLWNYAWGSMNLLSGQWMNLDGEALHMGTLYVLTFSLNIPVLRQADTFSLSITGMPITREIDDANGITTIEP